MVRFYPLAILFLSHFFLQGQGQNPVVPTPRIDFSLSPFGLFTSDNEQGAALFYPSASGKPVLANSGIWIAGKLPDGTLRASVNINSSASDFTFGPLSMQHNQLPDSNKWFRTWYLTRQMAEDQLFFKKPNYVIPDEVLDYPANPPQGYEGILAPFVDWNSNGIYEPHLGDAPVIEGDLMVYCVYNDFGTNRINPADSGLGVELKQFTYFIHNPQENQLLMLVRLLATNRNTFPVNSFKLGIYADLLLGQGNNNYVRTFPVQNAMAGYNANGQDAVYGNEIPAFALLVLNKKLAGTMYLTHDNDVVTGLPLNPAEVNNYLSGRWRNGKALTYGGNGVDGTTHVRYVYPALEDPDNQNFEWTEENSGSSAGKRNLLLVFDSTNFSAGQTLEFRYAYQVIPNANNVVSEIKRHLEQTQEKYGKGYLTSAKPSVVKESVSVYPNPVSAGREIQVSSPDKILALRITDLSGRQIFSQTFSQTENSRCLVVDSLAGIYYLQVQTLSGSSVHKLILH